MPSSSIQAGPILEIEKATVYRGDTCVFDDFSFVASRRGAHVAILGPNGARKSTFLKLLAGEVHPVPNDETSHPVVRRRAVECVGRAQAIGDGVA